MPRSMILLEAIDVHIVVQRGRDIDFREHSVYKAHMSQWHEDIVDFKNRLGWEDLFRYLRQDCLDISVVRPGEHFDKYIDVDDHH